MWLRWFLGSMADRSCINQAVSCLANGRAPSRLQTNFMAKLRLTILQYWNIVYTFQTCSNWNWIFQHGNNLLGKWGFLVSYSPTNSATFFWLLTRLILWCHPHFFLFDLCAVHAYLFISTQKTKNSSANGGLTTKHKVGSKCIPKLNHQTT